jgi:hypothetical protein
LLSKTINQDLEKLNPILALPDFKWNDQAQSIFWEWVIRQWDRLMEWIFGRGSNSSAQSEPTVVSIWLPSPELIVALILLTTILIYSFRSILADFVADVNTQDDNQPEILTPQTALDKARQLSSAGNYRSAIRYLYISSLLMLDERGLVRYDRSKTNREYLRTVAGQPTLSEPLNDVIGVFDRVWYGNKEIDQAGFEHYAQKVEELRGQKE